MSVSTLISILKEGKELYDEIKPKIDGKYITKRIPRIVGIIASSMLVFVYLHQYCNFFGYINIDSLPMFGDSIKDFISESISIGGIVWAVYHFIVYRILLRVVIYIDTMQKTTYIRYFKTADDIIEIVASGIYFLYASGELLHVANCGYPSIEFILLFYYAFIHLSLLFVGWVFRKNDYNPYTMSTGYCDNSNSIIREGTLVSYYNKLYWIVDGRKEIVGFQIKDNEDPYLLCAANLNSGDTITLEEAAKNKDGNLTVMKSYSSK